MPAGRLSDKVPSALGFYVLFEYVETGRFFMQKAVILFIT